MKYLYCLYDQLAEEYGPSFEAVNNDVACRSVVPLLNDTLDANDYQLLLIGSVDGCDVQPVDIEQIDFKPTLEAFREELERRKGLNLSVERLPRVDDLEVTEGTVKEVEK